MRDRAALARTFGERHLRNEPFELLTRPQRSVPARVVGLLIRLRAELLVGLVALFVGRWLGDLRPAWAAGLLVVLVLVAVAVWTPSRRYLVRRCFAVLTRHRFRAVCVERRIMNYSGNVPVLLWSRPTPVGERMWMLLRAGIDAQDIERNLSYVAVACWANDARVTPHRRVSALVVLDVIRRDPLTGPAVVSPFGTPSARRRARVVPLRVRSGPSA